MYVYKIRILALPPLSSDDGHQASARAVCVVEPFSLADSRTERLRVLLPASNSRHCTACMYLSSCH